METKARTDLRLFVFGRPQVWVGGQRADLAAGIPAKALALLVLNQGFMHRDALVERLWPDLSGGQEPPPVAQRTVLAAARDRGEYRP